MREPLIDGTTIIVTDALLDELVDNTQQVQSCDICSYYFDRRLMVYVKKDEILICSLCADEHYFER